MKNLFFLFFALILSAGTAFGQVSNTEIANAIRKATPVNREFSGINDPNKIYPGQTVWIPVEVKKGDTEWFMFRDMFYPVVSEELFSEQKEIQPVMEDVTPIAEPVVKKNKLGNLLEEFFLGLVLLLLFFGLIYVVHNLFFKSKKKEQKLKEEEVKFSSDPASEGPAFVEGGVHNEQEADQQFVDIAMRDNPHLNPSQIVISERRRVYVSTPNGEAAIVNFVNGTQQELAFRNVPGWIASVSIDGGKTFQRELFFQECGNPVYSRTSMTDAGLIITDEPINFGDEVMNSETLTDEVIDEKVNSLITKLEKEDQKTEVQKPVVEKRELQSDEVMIVNDHTKATVEFLKTQRAHRVTMDYQKNADGSVSIKSIFETKNDPALKEEVKKEN